MASPWPTPLAAAKAVIGAHPALVSLDPDAAAIVAATIDRASGLSALATAISKQGPAAPTSGWARLRDVGVVDGVTATAYDLSADTLKAATPVLGEVLLATQNDERLEGVLWFPHAAPVGGYHAVPPKPSDTWQIEGVAPRWGVVVSSVAFEAARQSFRLRLGNTAPRALAVYVEFRDAAGAPVVPAGWVSRLPAGLPPDFETATTKYLGLLDPTRRIEGIVMPPADLTIAVPQPADAVETVIRFGGLGAEPWSGVVDPFGATLTSVLGYAVPAIFVAAGASAEGYAALYTPGPLRDQVLAAAAFLRDAASASDALLRVRERIGPLVYGNDLPLLRAALFEHLTAAELAAAAATINWAPATLAQTVGAAASWSGSVLASPASFELRLSPNLIGELAVGIGGDPAHGAWPAAATRFDVSGRWLDGETTAVGLVQGLATASPQIARLAAVPANRAVELAVVVKDASGRICAAATAHAPIVQLACAPKARSLSVPLVERRPTLDASTRWEFALTLAYEKGHLWQTGPRPTATRKDLDSSGGGHHLASLVGLEVSSAGAGSLLAYTWQASGQRLPLCGSSTPTDGQIHAFQTLSALASPEAGLEFPSCGFSAPPFLMFESARSGFYVDPRQGVSRLRRFVPGQPFDLDPARPSYGRFDTPHLDDFVVHPDGVALAVSFRDSTFSTLLLGPGSSEAKEPVAGISGGRGSAPGRFGGPVALALTPSGDLLVLETLNARLQAVDVYGNPVPYFPGDSPILALAAEERAATYLDLAVDGDGYVAVLLFLGSGDAVADYRLDLYAPDGRRLATTPNVNAARIALDAWRNLYTLDYSHLLGPGGRTEPGVSVWRPQSSSAQSTPGGIAR